MARELRLNPKKFGSLANTKQEPWELPLPEYIEELYFKHFKKNRPDNVRSIERMVKDYHKKKRERKMRRSKEQETGQSGKGRSLQ
jgi:fructose-1,6-bisphosphatase